MKLILEVLPPHNNFHYSSNDPDDVVVVDHERKVGLQGQRHEQHEAWSSCGFCKRVVVCTFPSSTAILRRPTNLVKLS